MKTMIREIREDTTGIREENKVLREELEAVRDEKGGAKERISGSERGDEKKRREMAGRGGRLDEKDENYRGKDGTKRKEGEEE
jgi:hypothetical protein